MKYLFHYHIVISDPDKPLIQRASDGFMSFEATPGPIRAEDYYRIKAQLGRHFNVPIEEFRLTSFTLISKEE